MPIEYPSQNAAAGWQSANLTATNFNQQQQQSKAFEKSMEAADLELQKGKLQVAEAANEFQRRQKAQASEDELAQAAASAKARELRGLGRTAQKSGDPALIARAQFLKRAGQSITDDTARSLWYAQQIDEFKSETQIAQQQSVQRGIAQAVRRGILTDEATEGPNGEQVPGAAGQIAAVAATDPALAQQLLEQNVRGWADNQRDARSLSSLETWMGRQDRDDLEGDGEWADEVLIEMQAGLMDPKEARREWNRRAHGLAARDVSIAGKVYPDTAGLMNGNGRPSWQMNPQQRAQLRDWAELRVANKVEGALKFRVSGSSPSRTGSIQDILGQLEAPPAGASPTERDRAAQQLDAFTTWYEGLVSKAEIELMRSAGWSDSDAAPPRPGAAGGSPGAEPRWIQDPSAGDPSGFDFDLPQGVSTEWLLSLNPTNQ